MKIRILILTAICCAFAFSLFAAGPAHPAKPGKWQVTTEMDMPGMPMKPEPQTHIQCVTKEDLEKNPEASVPKQYSRRTGEERNDCKISDYKVTENTVTWNLKCEGGRAPVTGSGKITYAADSYNGSMAMKIGDREMTAKYSGKYLGECDKTEQKK